MNTIDEATLIALNFMKPLILLPITELVNIINKADRETPIKIEVALGVLIDRATTAKFVLSASSIEAMMDAEVTRADLLEVKLIDNPCSLLIESKPNRINRRDDMILAQKIEITEPTQTPAIKHSKLTVIKPIKPPINTCLQSNFDASSIAAI